MEFITAWLINYGLVTAGGTLLTLAVGYILKKIPTDRFAVWAKKVGRSQGLAVTAFFNAKIPKFWNGLIEPIVIDTLNAIGIGWLSGFIAGLKSDNKADDNSEHA